jgi:hypothetical protein
MPRYCIHQGCKSRALFNFYDHLGVIYCSKHKLPGMMLQASLYCQHEGCRTMSSFGFPGTTKRLYCRTHKLEGMERNIKSRKKNNLVAHQRKCEDQTTLKRARKAKPRSRSSSPSSCSSCSSVNSTSSRSMTSRATKIGKVWQTNQGVFFVPSLPRTYFLS